MSYVFIGQAFRIPGEANSPDLNHYNRIVRALHPLFAKKISLFSFFIKTDRPTRAKMHRRTPIPIGVLLHFPLFPYSWTVQMHGLYNARRRLKHERPVPQESSVLSYHEASSLSMINLLLFIKFVYKTPIGFYILHLTPAACLPPLSVLKWTQII